MTRLTALPAATDVPAAGLSLMTDPAGTVALDAVVTVPTVRPAAVIALVAAACVRPTTFGTLTGAGPDDTTRFTALPAATDVRAAGVAPLIDPAATVALERGGHRPDGQPRRRDRARRRRLRQADHVRHPDRRRAGRHDEVHRAAGGERRAGRRTLTDDRPAATVALDAVVTVPTVRPAVVIALVAAACVRPTTFGTVTSAPDRPRRQSTRWRSRSARRR